MKIENLQQLKEIIINEIEPNIIDRGKTPYQFDNNKILFSKLNNKYNNFFVSISELIYLCRNINNLENLHIFCSCGNKNTFKGINKQYSFYCCVKCSNSNELKKNKIKQTNLKHWGVTCNWKSKDPKLNGRYTKLIKYNDENYNNQEKSKQTCLKKYGVEYSFQSKNNKEKTKQTMLKKYNIEHNWKSKDPKLNGKRTMLNKYNVLYSMQNKIILNKMLNTKLNNIDENGLNSYQRAILKIKQTKKQRYNNENYNNKEKTKQTRLNNIDENGLNSYQRMYLKKLNNIDENGLNSIERAKIKEYQTKKKNNSFNTSKNEEQVYNYLLQKFNKDDIERQYKSNLYPFNCDFYIRSLDLYIECHFSWAHGNKPFKNSIEDLIELEKLKKKSQEINFKGKKKDYYKNMIHTWTNLDIRKLQTFKQNKLNYKIFYNLKQFNNWFNKINL